jgi:hypothetical protein
MNESLEIFLHGKGVPQVLTALSTDTLHAFLSVADALPAPGQFVFVGEALDDEHEDAEEDAHAPADLARTFAEFGILRHGHIHTRAVHRVQVTVHFNGQEVHHRFSPATTIARVTAWSKRKLKLDPHASADLVLAIKPSNVQPRPDQHLGELLPPGEHAIEFDLVREITPQG